jgi:4-hydroxybenzoyl-CoA reductase subunit beta
MTEILPEFKLIRPATVDDALIALTESPSARMCAGGTDLIVNMRHGLVDVETLLDLGNIAELTRLESDQNGLYIGAGVTLRQLAENLTVANDYAAVTEAASVVAAPGHREVATVGGNLCLDTRCLYYNQSHQWRKSNGFCLKYKGDICHVAPQGNRCRAAFSGDLAPSMIVHNAELEIAGQKGRRQIQLADFYCEDGAAHLALDPTEIVVGVRLPPASATSSYEKVRIRGAIDFPLSGVAVACRKTKKAGWHFSVAITGTNSCPVVIDIPEMVADDDEDDFFVALGKSVQRNVSPQRTTTTSAHYRRLSIAALATRLAKRLWAD